MVATGTVLLPPGLPEGVVVFGVDAVECLPPAQPAMTNMANKTNQLPLRWRRCCLTTGIPPHMDEIKQTDG